MLYRVDRGLDKDRLVADDLDVVALGHGLPQRLQPFLQLRGHFHGVRARLLADIQQHAGVSL